MRRTRNKYSSYTMGKMITTKKWHVLDSGGFSVCGYTNDAYCYNIQKIPTTPRLHLAIFPGKDLNYCQRCKHILKLIRNGG